MNCLGMWGEKLGRFTVPSLAPPQRRPEVLQTAKKKTMRSPSFELFSQLWDYYDQCKPRRMYNMGLHFHISYDGFGVIWCRGKLSGGIFCRCPAREETSRVQRVRKSYGRLMINRWELMFSLVDVWWKLPITRLEDLVLASGVHQCYELLTLAGGESWWTSQSFRGIDAGVVWGATARTDGSSCFTV